MNIIKMNNKTEVVDKLERFLIDNKKIKLETLKEIYPFLNEIRKQLSIHCVVNRRELLCDDCNKQSKYIAVLCKECYLKDSEL